MRKVKKIGLNPTTRFEDIELNYVIGWCKKLRILNRLLAEETPAGVKPIYSDSKVTNIATLILKNVKEIRLNPTTRFEDLDLNCVIEWFKKIGIPNRLLAEETPVE